MTILRTFVAALCGLVLFSAPGFAAGHGGEKKDRPVDEAARRVTTSDAYVPMFGLAASVIALGRPAIVTVDAGLEVPNATLRARILQVQPRLRDALRASLSDYATNYYRAGTAPNPDEIKRLLQRATDATVGPGAQVLLANVLVQQR